MRLIFLLLLCIFLNNLKAQGDFVSISASNCGKYLKIGDMNFNVLSNLKETSTSYDIDYYFPFLLLNRFALIGLGVMHQQDDKNMLLGKVGLNFDLNTQWKLSFGTNYNYVFTNKSSVFNLYIDKRVKLTRLFKRYYLFAKLMAGLNYFSFNKATVFNFGMGLTYANIITCRKPVLYIYSPDSVDLDVKMQFVGKLKYSFPQYNDVWRLKVLANSEIVDKASGKRYPYLFWEGDYLKPSKESIKTGFIVKKSDLAEFLYTKLNEIGLNYREINDFITYWVPNLEHSKYLIHFFQNDSCNSICSYLFSRQPSSFIRVLVWFVELQPSEHPVIEPQTLIKNKRNDFTIVEWGGSVIK